MIASLLLLAAPAFQEPARTAPDREGPLDNDTFVDVNAPAGEALARGDAELTAARDAAKRATPAETTRRLELALDAWHDALVAGGPGAVVWFDAQAKDSGRLAEGTGAAVARRLAALAPDERARWSARHATTADDFLAGARGSADWVETVRRHPCTRAAARAALRLADEALESGEGERASAWLARAERHAREAGADELGAALTARRAHLSPAAPHVDRTWETATHVELAGSLRWKEPLLTARPPRGNGLPGGLRPGLAFRSGSELWLQSEEELLRISRSATGTLEIAERFSPGDLVAGFLGVSESEDEPRDAARWPLAPLADELGCVLILGRALGGEPNALASFEPTADPLAGIGLERVTGTPRARATWAWVGANHIDARGNESEVAELTGLESPEFEPGPAIVAGTVVVQVREYAGQVRALLLGLDRRDGRLRWKTPLAAGAERVPVTRFAVSTRHEPGQPLLVVDGEDGPLVFAGTSLGAGALVDALTGEVLWVFKCRRRDTRSPGWSTERPLHDGRSPATILWGPPDSDQLYFLRAGAAQGELGVGVPGVMVRPPVARDDALALLGGDADEQTLLDGAPGRGLLVRRPGRDRVDALALAPGERFRGTGLFSPTRVWTSTDRGVYLFDRERELYLLDFEPLKQDARVPAGGDLYARGDAVLVLGDGMLWSLRTR